MTGTPTLYQWAGGADAFDALCTAFYARAVEDDLLGDDEAVDDNVDPVLAAVARVACPTATSWWVGES